jgi:hypothetical protein
MKLFTWSVVSLFALFTLSCQKTDQEREKEAILAVLEEESAATLAGDFDRYKATHVHDDLETRIEMGIHSYRVYRGWDEISKTMSDYIVGNTNTGGVNRKENLIIKVNGNSAWLTCDNIWDSSTSPGEILYNNLQIVFLEKIKGEWKISFSAYYTKGDMDDTSFQ